MAPTSINPPAEEATAQPATPSPSIDQVRELLFGPHYRELERKLARIESQLHADADELRKETRRRVEALESHEQREIDGLGARIEAEQAARSEAVSAAVRESREAISALEQRLAKLEQALLRVQRETNQHVLDQAKKIFDELERSRQEMLAAWERDLGLLRSSSQDVSLLPPPRSPESH